MSSTDIPSQAGRTAIVTGANRGLGLEIAAALAAAGARVVLACRSLQRGEAAKAEIHRRVPRALLEVAQLDLADLTSVRHFAQNFSSRFEPLHLLCNNASAILVPKGKTRDGFETHIGVNHLGTFALTGLLLAQMRAAPGARIVNTSSLAHTLTPGLDLDDLHWQRKPYKEMHAYGASKLATLLFTFELARRLPRAGIAVKAVAAHPGYAATNLELGGFFMRLSTRLFAQPAAHGAWPALHAATGADVQSGDYWGPGGFKELKGPPKRAEARPEARDPDLAARLWERSERETGVRYAL